MAVKRPQAERLRKISAGRRKAVKVRRYRGARASKAAFPAAAKLMDFVKSGSVPMGDASPKAVFCFFGCLHRLAPSGRGDFGFLITLSKFDRWCWGYGSGSAVAPGVGVKTTVLPGKNRRHGEIAAVAFISRAIWQRRVYDPEAALRRR